MDLNIISHEELKLPHQSKVHLDLLYTIRYCYEQCFPLPLTSNLKALNKAGSAFFPMSCRYSWGSPKCLQGHMPKTLSRFRAAFFFTPFWKTSSMTALTPKSFKFKLKPGNWQHATPCAGSLLITRERSFLFHKCKNQIQYEQRLMVRQKSEWKSQQ